MSGSAAATVSKSEFAQMIGVSPGRISQYISERKIFGDALEGEGRRARIRPTVAAGQLNMTLEPSQRFGGNGLAHRQLPLTEQPASRPAASPLQVKPVEMDEIAAERLKQMRLKTAAAERDEALANGRYMLADQARREMGRVAADAFKVMEQGLRAMAEELAEQFGMPQRDAHLVLQRAFRHVRERAAARQRTEATGEPDLIEDAETTNDGQAAA